MSRPDRPRIDVCEPRLLLSAEALLGGSIDQPVDLVLPPADSVAVSGSLPTGEQTFYRFTAPAAGRVQADMLGTGGLDSYLEVFSSTTGRLVARNDNASRLTKDSRVQLRVQEGQTFIIRATGTKGTAGDYSLSLLSRPIDDIGNTFGNARTLRLNRLGAGTSGGKVNYADDVDVLTLVATRTGSMTVKMQARGRHNALDSELFAYDDAGTLLEYNDEDPAGGPGAAVTFDVVKGNRYYIKTGSVDTSKGAYLLKLSTVDAPPPEPDPQPDPDTPTPQASVLGQIFNTAAGLLFRVLGTNGNDTITLTQSGASVTLTAGTTSTRYDGSFASLSVYGFGGADMIRLASSVLVSGAIYGGDGADQLFDAGPGACRLAGGEGNDLLVSIGGGADTVTGEAGLDSLWADTADTLADTTAEEIAATNVHRISSFYQPYTTDPNNPAYVSLQIAGQNLTDPTASYAYASFVGRPLFVDGAQYDDIAQGAVGDCYYVASLASLADTDPARIEQMVAPLGDGTYAVRFYRNGSEVYLRVDAHLPVYSGTSLAYAKLGRDGELWVPIMEKAYAYFRYGMNSYASISGGWMSTVYQELTNVASPWRYTSGSAVALYDYLASCLAAGHATTMGSYSSASGPIVGSHAYMVKSLQTTDGVQTVTLYNPWAVDGRSWDSNPNDGLLTISIAQVQTYFQAIAVAMV